MARMRSTTAPASGVSHSVRMRRSVGWARRSTSPSSCSLSSIRTSAIGSMPSQFATSAWLTPSLPAMFRMTAACCRVIGSPICRARRSKRRLINLETSWTRKPNARPTPAVRNRSSSTITANPEVFAASLGAMTTLRQAWCWGIGQPLLQTRWPVGTADPARDPFKIEIDHRRRIKRQPLRHQQPADDRDAERLAQFRATATTKRNRHRAEQRGERRHHDRPEAQQAGLMDRLLRALAFEALGLQREVDHHDRVLFDDTDQQDDADDRDHRQLVMQEHQ